MRVSMDAVLEQGKLCEAAICYTGNMLEGGDNRYDLEYYLTLARELEAAGAHILCIKDMSGVLRPAAATELFSALRETVTLPVHFHTHDTSGASAASVLAAVHAGVDAVDAAMDAFAGNTSQPCLGSLVAAIGDSGRDSGLSLEAVREISFYWETVRGQYAAFESDLKSPASEVYLHEMPGGQFTNLKEQARSLGLASRWHEVAKTYSDVNALFGDIVKVTPSSKVVGDMTLMMMSQDLSIENVLDPEHDIAFPDSVVSMMRGELSQVPGGFPEAIRSKVLKGEEPLSERAGARMAPADLEATRAELADDVGLEIDDRQLASALMYPKVFREFCGSQRLYGPTSKLPTPVYFYGMKRGEEIYVDIEQGKTLVIRCVALSEANDEGRVRVFFELNGQPRSVRVPDRLHGASSAEERRKADPAQAGEVSAPMPGVVSGVSVSAGQDVSTGDVLLSIEAMKMETAIYADATGKVAEVLVKTGDQIDAKDLLVRIDVAAD